MKTNTKIVNDAFAEIGEHIKTWRRLYKLKASQVAERAGISQGTLHKIESGDHSISTSAFLEVARSLGLLDALTESLDPLNTDLGRARVTESLPKRIR
ncbi:MAG: helix-turn-helix domain-containing protein [Oscillospiraceae bacterium]|nr:helix-turn-helix domain-containing protein [Oscillospiraceae bacterium]